MSIYNNGGYVTVVCHGVVGLLNLKLQNNQYLINNKKITGFTNTEELLIQKQNKIPFLVQNALVNKGAKYIKKRFFKSHGVCDNRVITGQNPWSAKVVATLLLKEIK